MTNHQNLPANPHGYRPAQTVPGRAPRGAWSVVDAVASSLLAFGVGVVNFGCGFAVLMGWAMSSDPCGPSGPCPSQDAANHAFVIACIGLLLSLVVAVGGIVFSASKNVVMIWAPITGLLITGLTLAIVVSVAG